MNTQEDYPISRVECPNCGEDLSTPEVVHELADNPYSNTEIECDGCKKELSLSLWVEVFVRD